nr:ATPase subunit 6 [Ophisternon infernale]
MTLNLFEQFTNHTFLGIPLMTVSLILPWILYLSPSSRWLSNRMLTLQGWFINKFTKQLMSPLNINGHKWATILTSLMIFLMSSNLLGLLPYTFTPTAQLSFNMGFAIPLWMVTVLIGIRNQPSHTLAHLLPEGTPALLTPILVVIETISLFIRPLALGVRLTANITAGHLLIQLISVATLTLMPITPVISLLPATLLLLLTLLEIAVAMIQAYVFVLLLSLYMQENT